MRIFKILLTAAAVVIALLGGVFVAAIIAVAALAIWVNNRFFGKRPTSRASIRSAPPPPRVSPSDPTDSIEVTATEVPEPR